MALILTDFRRRWYNHEEVSNSEKGRRWYKFYGGEGSILGEQYGGDGNLEEGGAVWRRWEF